MLNVRANDEHFATSLDSKSIRSAGMVVPERGHHGFYIVVGCEVLAGISDLQELEICPHVIQLHREILGLHLDFENLLQVGDCLAPAERQKGDFLAGIISWGKKGKTLDVVPVKMREPDIDSVLLVADGAEVFAEISYSRARVNDGDSVCICERDLQAGGVTAELLETDIADRDGSPRPVKLELHRVALIILVGFLKVRQFAIALHG